MVKSRVLEERLIQMYKQGQSHFWIGGPGEEAFGVPLGLLVRKGSDINDDWLHLHYRASSTLVAMDLPIKEAIRLAMNKATDSHTKGRNFSNHFCVPKWNVAPVNSVIGTQYSIALGTAYIQSRFSSSAITIVTGGDAGTASPDFASCLVWSSRPQQPLPILITVQNNKWGISTPYYGQHGESRIVERGKAFNIKTAYINGNDPVESYLVLKQIIKHIREQRCPVLLEASVSRLYGHSSASGANYVKEVCPIELFEKKLQKAGIITKTKCEEVWKSLHSSAKKVQQEVKEESNPLPGSVWEHVYANEENADWRKF